MGESKLPPSPSLMTISHCNALVGRLWRWLVSVGVHVSRPGVWVWCLPASLTTAHPRQPHGDFTPPPYLSTPLFRFLLRRCLLRLELSPQLASLLEFWRVQVEILRPGDGLLQLVDVPLVNGSVQTRNCLLLSLPKAGIDIMGNM